MPYNPTPAQRALKQSAVAGTITALAAIAGGTYQYALGHGLNIPALLLFLAPFVTGQALTLWHTLASNPQLVQAETDTLKNLPAEIQELPDLVHSLHGKFDNLIDYLTRRANPPPTTVPDSRIVSTGIASIAQPPAGWSTTNAPMQITPATGFAQTPLPPQQSFPGAPLFPQGYTADVPAVSPPAPISGQPMT